MTSPPATSAPQRIYAIDALRGFDMFWITGGREMLLGLAALITGGVPVWLDYHLGHPEWTGFSAWDMIMPMFLFITGAAMPFSFQQRLGEQRDYPAIYRKMARRVALLWVFGMVVQGNLISSIVSMDISDLRLYSNTLQAIASGYVIAAVALLHLPRWGQRALCAVLLLLYWALLTFVPVPGHGAGQITPDGNLALWVDEVILRGFRDGTHYTWILSGLGFGGTVLLGVFAGQALGGDATPRNKFFWLVGAGVACLLGGALWGQFHPIVKHIWTSSMVLWSGGWCYLLLAAFYALIDLGGYKKWAFPFMIIGANALLAYMVGEAIVAAFTGGAEEMFGEHILIEAASATVAFALMWAGLYFLYKKRWFLRV
jgi:predicted acyltransferase